LQVRRANGDRTKQVRRGDLEVPQGETPPENTLNRGPLRGLVLG